MSVGSEVPAREKRRRRLGGVIIAAAALGFAAMVFSMLARVEPIEVINSRLGRAGDSVFVEGTLKNTGADIGPIDLQVSYYDGQGHRLAEDKVAVGGLRGGAETTFRSRARQLEGVRDFTILIDRGRNAYGN